MTRPGKFKVKIEYEDSPIVKGKFDNIEKVEDVFKTLKRKFK